MRLNIAGFLVATVFAITACGTTADSSDQSSAGKPGESSPKATTPSEPPRPTRTRTPDGTVFKDTESSGYRIRYTNFTGPISGVTLKVSVWTPPQYDDPAYANKGFPVLFLFPGGPGNNYNTWTDNASYGGQDTVVRGSKDGSILPFIFVMPYQQLSAKLETECTDIPGQPAVGTWMDTDLVTMISNNFRTLLPGPGWGAMGMSSGGYCAAALSFRKPQTFGASASIGGYFHIDTAIPAAKAPEIQALSPDRLAVDAPPPVKAWVGTGDASSHDLKRSQAFVAKCAPPTVCELKIFPGGKHTTEAFEKMVPSAFAFLSKHMQGPQPD